jgi:DNA polymerase I
MRDRGLRAGYDAVLVAAPLERLEADVEAMQQVMREASRIVLDGFELRADAQIVKYPDRYMDERGEVMWGRVMALMDQIE